MNVPVTAPPNDTIPTTATATGCVPHDLVYAGVQRSPFGDFAIYTCRRCAQTHTGPAPDAVTAPTVPLVIDAAHDTGDDASNSFQVSHGGTLQ